MIVYFGIGHFYIQHLTEPSATNCVLVHQNRIWDFSPELKTFGVTLKTPVHVVRQHPNMTVITMELQDYQPHTKEWMQFSQEWTDQIEPEYPHAWYCQLPDHLSCEDFGAAFLARVQAQELTGMWGAGCSKMVAKLAAHRQRNQWIQTDQTAQFLNNLPIQWLDTPEVKQLHRLGIETIGQLSQVPCRELVNQFGFQGQTLYSLAKGLDPIPFTPHHMEEIAWHLDVSTLPDIQGPLSPPQIQHYLQQGLTHIVESIPETQAIRSLEVQWDDGTGQTTIVKNIPTPTRTVNILARILRHKLSSIPVHQLSLRVLQTETITSEQLGLLQQTPPHKVEAVRDRLRGYLLDELTIPRREKLLELWKSAYL